MEQQSNYDFTKLKEYKLVKFLTPVAMLICSTMYRVRYVGRENIPKTGGLIIAANHKCVMDPVIVGTGARKRTVHFMAKEELFEKPFPRWFLTRMNAFPVRRGRGDMTALNFAGEIIKSNGVLGIFPEGTVLNAGERPARGKSGIGLIAKQTGADVLPVAVIAEKKFSPFSRVTVRFGEVIPNAELGFTEEGKSRELKNAADLIMARITELWEEGL